jgi:hypothetical protein
MADQDFEADRLATQRSDDLERAQEHRVADLAVMRENERTRAQDQGRREGLQAAHTAGQDRHLATINGSIEGFRTDLKLTNAKVDAVQKTVDEFLAVTRALEQKGVSTRTFVMGVAALLLPILILVVTLAVTGK